jgi:hypothetical protein
MEKSELIKLIAEKVAAQLSHSVLDQFTDFEITQESEFDLTIECNDTLSGGRNTCKFSFEWYN